MSLLPCGLVPVGKANGWRRDCLRKKEHLSAGQAFEGRIRALKRLDGISAFETFAAFEV